MNKYICKSFKALGLIGFGLFPIVSSIFNTNYTYRPVLTNSSKTTLNQSIAVNYDAGSWYCTGGSYMVNVVGKFNQTLYADLQFTMYRNSLYVANMAIKSAFNLTSNDEIKDLTYDRSTNVISFTSLAYFYLSCQHIKNPQDLPGMPELPKSHVHSNLQQVRIKNTNVTRPVLREYAKETKVIMQLSKDILLDNVDLSAIKFDNLLQVDNQKTFRGFNANYFGLKANNEYLKALIISAENQKWLRWFKTRPEYNQIYKNVNFEKILVLLSKGLILDFNSAYTQRLVDKEILSNANYNVNHWINKVVNDDISFSQIENIENTKFANWIHKYNLSEIPFLNDSFIDLFFSNGFRFNLVWSSNDEQTITTDFNLVYTELHKQFNLLDNSNQQMLISIDDDTNSKFIKIQSINWLSDSRYYNENSNTSFLDNDFKIVYPNQQNFVSNPKFNITKIITANNFESAFDWVGLLDLSKYAETDVHGIPTILDTPETLIKNQEYIKALLQFNQINNAITIYDTAMKKALMQNNDTLYNNKQLDYFVDSFTISAYNSKNQVMLNFEFNDIDANNQLISNDKIKHQIFLDLTPHKIIENSNTEILHDVVEIENPDNTSLLTSFVLDNYVQYADNNVIEKPLIKTSLNKKDWIDNVFIDLIVNNKTETDWTCLLKYGDTINKNNLKNTKEIFVNFTLVFEENKPEIILPDDNQEVIETKPNYDIWIMWGLIGLGLFLAIMLISIYIYTKKQQTKKSF